MERFVHCLLVTVALTATLASATYSSYPFRGTAGFGWGYGLGHPVVGMGLGFGGAGIGRPGFALPVSPISFGYGYRPYSPSFSYSYNPYGTGYGFGLNRFGYGSGGYLPRYSSGYGGRYYSAYDDDDDDRFWPYSGIDDWDLDGFDVLGR